MRAVLHVLAFIPLAAGQSPWPGGGGLPERADEPPPTLAECAELFFSGRCNQTSMQQIASAGSPLLRPLPFYRIFEVLGVGNEQTLAAWGTFKDMGSYDLCVADAASHHCTVQAFGGPSLGLCLPRGCSVHDYLRRYRCEELLIFDSANATAALVPVLRNATVALQALSKALEYLAVRSRSFCAEDVSYDLTPGALAMAVVTATLGAAVVGSTLVAHLLRPAWHARHGALPGGAPRFAWARHFDAVGNARRLVATRPAGELDFLDGLRVLSTGYVELGHQFLIAAFSSKNVVPAVSDYLRSFEVTAILGAFSSVDTFFWMSGLLAALALLRRADARGDGEQRAPVGVRRALAQAATALLHRLARLTPVYAYVLFAYTHVLPLVGSGPLWAQAQRSGEVCTRTWWTNLLYVNNVLGEDGQNGTAGCMGWSWYLANDMQFFAAAAFALPFYPAAPRLVVGFFVGALALSVGASAALSHAYAADITTLDVANGKYLYAEPHTRCGTYAVGVLFGIFLHERARAARFGARLPSDAGGERAPLVARRERATWAHAAGWAASVGVLLAVFLLPWTNFSAGGLFDKSAQRWTPPAKDVYNGTQRQLWALGLCGLSHWLLSGRGGPVRALLSAPLWQVLAKLSYGA